MTKLEHALALALDGFWVFPVLPGKKIPAVKFKSWATRDETVIQAWWTGHPDSNIGIYTGRFRAAEALLVVDIDNKGDKRGDDAAMFLDLPDTREHSTPTGGRHLLYSVSTAVRQGVNVLGDGLDIRSAGGYILAPGSTIADQAYTILTSAEIISAPDWLIQKCGAVRKKAAVQNAITINKARAEARAVQYLTTEAPIAIEGQSGDNTTYKIAARLKDLGVSEPDAVRLMLEHWNHRCTPPWLPEHLAQKVQHAYTYGTAAPGVSAPETEFDSLEDKDGTEHPYKRMNREFAFVLAGGGAHILWETTDARDRWKLEHLSVSAFHQKFAAYKLQVGSKTESVTEGWMEWKGRRSYDGIVFLPNQSSPQRFYNLWRGFSVVPFGSDETPSSEAKAALALWLEHVHQNICQGDPLLARWVLGWCAHLIQKPDEKPSVALVMRGGKGVGKNVFIECVGRLLGGHFLLSSNRRYLVSNFTGHLENCLLFALDEAFWSGDKPAEGALKDLITGTSHVIEHKGKEPYTVDNRTRVAIIGNESWLVPASTDERRFCVVNVGDGRKQDTVFFQSMRRGMDLGGDRLLLGYLQNYSLLGIDLNVAPQTKALLDQKHATLGPVPQWWLDCLIEGRIVGSDFDQDWPQTVECERFRQAFRRYATTRNIRARLPSDKEFGAAIKVCAALFHGRARTGASLVYTYKLPPLDECRKKWEYHIGQSMEWPS